jgi:penicillin amidase
LVAVLAPVLTRWQAQASFPEIDGEIQLAGLDGPVEIYRDSFGIPHIYATTSHDLFFAQGYVHAQERFWQMDFWRHQGAGRISELVGDLGLGPDQFIRTLGWERIAQAELDVMDPEPVGILTSYAEGVNAYLADHQGTELGLEYAFLPLVNRGYQPAPWTPLNTLTWEKAMAWDLSGNMNTEISKALLLGSLPPEMVEQLFLPYPEDRPVIVPHPHLTTGAPPAFDAAPSLAVVVTPALLEVNQAALALNAVGRGNFDGIGSNSWVLSPELTDTGMPILANDPHLSSQMPSIWYQVGLHCSPKGPDCPYDVAGFSFAGAPGIIIGHTDRVAWGLTNVGPDVMDLYIEKINPQNPNQYEFEGQWVDMEIIRETIQVAGGESLELDVRLTRHGPIITEVYDLEDFGVEAGIEVPEHYAIALSWTALEPSCVFCAIWQLDKAQNWDDFRAALSHFAVPSQNIIYADLEGNIGYQTPGNIPIRVEGHTGMVPVPGWTGEFEWQGFIPYEEMPFSFNPPEGYIVTANNAVVGPEYPYTIARQWAYGFRAQRIVDMIEAAPGAISVEDTRRMQGDDKDLLAEQMVPVLLGISLDNDRLEEARAILKGWDYQMHMDSAPAALYAAFWRNLLILTFVDDLPEFYQPAGEDEWMELARMILTDPGNPWWDDQATSPVETRDDIFRQALQLAVDELRSDLGKNPSKWAWGDLHTITFANQVMGSIPLVSTAFNRGPFRSSGGDCIVNATGWSPIATYEIDWLPSMRMIVDMSDLQASLTVHTTGQSGHSYHPHYIDMADLWRNIDYYPMHWDRAAVEADAEGYLRLVP